MSISELKPIKNFFRKFNFKDFFFYGALWLLLIGFLFGLSPADMARALWKYDSVSIVNYEPSFLKCDQNRIKVSSFKEDEECVSWRNSFGLDALIFLDDENTIVRPNLTGNFSTGREVFLEKKFGSDNQISLEAIPQSGEKVNVSINYGSQWRVIIGDGDYNRVRLQVNSKYPKENLSTDDWVTVPELSGKNWIFPNRGLEPRKKISIIVRSQAKEGSNIVDVDVTVKGLLKGGDRSEDFNFHYSVSMTQKANESFERIGFGLLDPHQENIATMLQYFEVIPLSRYHAQ